ncbi:hypothetical protein [uncultured Fibrobacter sp.]|nr:hypothetical protein [uncultured Fibrobacter sp.]
MVCFDKAQHRLKLTLRGLANRNKVPELAEGPEQRSEVKDVEGSLVENI